MGKSSYTVTVYSGKSAKLETRPDRTLSKTWLSNQYRRKAYRFPYQKATSDIFLKCSISLLQLKHQFLKRRVTVVEHLSKDEEYSTSGR